MHRIDHVRLMAAYNASLNRRVYDAAHKLSAAALAADRHAFFGSILGTLNHLVNGDIIWRKRFALHPTGHRQLDPMRELSDPASLGVIAFTDLDRLWVHRQMLDQIILDWSAALTEGDLDHTLHYTSSLGVTNKNYFSLVMHFFNHQTHHRGQISTLLSQEHVDIGVTDLLFMIPEDARN